MSGSKNEGLIRLPWVINDPDRMYAYSIMLSQLHPQKALDVGMFLKRIGAISRSFWNFDLPADTALYGLDLTMTEVAVYQSIFEQIATPADYMERYAQEQFDLAVLFLAKELMDTEAYHQLWNWLPAHTRFVFTDDGETAKRFCRAVSPVSIRDREYYILKY